MALGENCCSYTNHSGIIRDNLAVLQKNLAKREKALNRGDKWFPFSFLGFSWLGTLLSAVAGSSAPCSW